MTAYYKLIDWWMMFCMMILVVTMLFHTYLNILVRNAQKRIAKKEAEEENGKRSESARSSKKLFEK